MSGWFLFASAIGQYQRKVKILNYPLLHLKTSGNCKIFTMIFIWPGRNLSSLLHSSALHESRSKLS